ncbi:MAG: MFS transporter [Candidatus Micrarchaeota archaeon]
MAFKEILSTPGIKPVLFTLFMASFGFGVILPLLPFYAESLGAKPYELGMLTATFATMSLIFAPLFGRLSDSIGRKKVLMIGTAGFSASYIVFAFSNSLPMLFVARGLEGLFAAGIFPASISLLSDLTSDANRGRAMGLVGMSFSLGFIVGPAFGGLASGISVQAAFLLAAGLAAINFASVRFQITEPAPKEQGKDIIGKEVRLFEHLTSPLVFVFLSTFVIAFMFGGLDATLAIYTGDEMGFSSPQVGLVFTFIGFLIMAMQFAGGALISKYGELRMIPVGFALSGLGFFTLIWAHSWPFLLASLAIFVAGNALVFPSVNSLVSKRVTTNRGAALGLVTSFQSLGQIIGPLTGGFLYGYSHDYPFAAMALVIWAYAAVFILIGRPKLTAGNARKDSANA